MTFKNLRKASGMNQREFAEYFNIPLRNIENWESGSRKCSQYLIDLMHYKLQKEGFVLVWESERMEAAEKTARDKESIADMLTVKLTEAESKLGEYPKMKETESYLRDELAKALQIIKDNQKDAEIAQERAVTAVYQEMGKALADADKEKNAAVSQLQAELAGVKASVTEKDKQVDKLESKNDGLQTLIAELRAKNAELESKNKQLETMLNPDKKKGV